MVKVEEGGGGKNYLVKLSFFLVKSTKKVPRKITSQAREGQRAPPSAPCIQDVLTPILIVICSHFGKSILADVFNEPMPVLYRPLSLCQSALRIGGGVTNHFPQDFYCGDLMIERNIVVNIKAISVVQVGNQIVCRDSMGNGYSVQSLDFDC
jgi:hypothetical protein